MHFLKIQTPLRSIQRGQWTIRAEATIDEVEEREVSQSFAILLLDLDDGEDEVPNPKTDPATAFRFAYDGWVRRGGSERGKRRHSVRQIKEWLGQNQVPSLETKLAGKTWLQRSEALSLLRLFLTRWTYDEASGDYAPYPSPIEFDDLVRQLLDDLFPEGQKALLLPTRVRKVSVAGAADQTATATQSSTFEKTRPTRDAIPDLFAKSDVLITVSRARTVIGPNPAAAMLAFHNLMERLYKVDTTPNDQHTRALIWIIDFGLRNDKEAARAAIQNFYFLLAQFRAIALIEREGREEFYAWLLDKVVFIVGSLRHKEIDRVYAEAGIKLPKAPPDLLWFQSDRLFLESIPGRWIEADGSEAFGPSQRELWKVPTITAHLKLDDWRDEDLVQAGYETDIRKNLRYLLHATVDPKPVDPNEPAVRCISLPEPGSRWSDAYRLAVQAAFGRLNRPSDKRTGVVKPMGALAALRNQHFAVLRLEEALHLNDILVDQRNEPLIEQAL